MRRTRCSSLALLLALLFVPALLAAETTAEKIDRGTALHDQQRYSEAITIYREVLAAEPDNEHALFELAYSLSASGAHDECVSIAQRGLKVAKNLESRFHGVLGTCLDESGKPEKAAKAYAKGLDRFPEDPLLAFNYAVTEARLDHHAQARKLIKISIQARPNHASSHWVYATSLAKENFQVPSLLAALRFLALEPEGPRAKVAAMIALEAFHRGVSQTAPDKVVLSIDSKASTEEGDFSSESMTLGLFSAARFTDEQRNQSAAEQVAEQTKSFLSLLSERPAAKGSPSFVEAMEIPPLLAIHRAGLAVAFAHLAFSTLELQGASEWRAANGKELEKLRQFLEQAKSTRP